MAMLVHAPRWGKELPRNGLQRCPHNPCLGWPRTPATSRLAQKREPLTTTQCFDYQPVPSQRAHEDRRNTRATQRGLGRRPSKLPVPGPGALSLTPHSFQEHETGDGLRLPWRLDGPQLLTTSQPTRLRHHACRLAASLGIP